MTVGPGIPPDLLTHPNGMALAGCNRRWGISPRPENEIELGAGRAFVNGAMLKRRLVQSAALLCHFFAQNVTKLC